MQTLGASARGGLPDLPPAAGRLVKSGGSELQGPFVQPSQVSAPCGRRVGGGSASEEGGLLKMTVSGYL